MKIKKFQAPNIQDAMRQVKEDLGADAVILHTRNVRRKGVWGWLGLDQVEVTAALDVKIKEPILPKPSPKPVIKPADTIAQAPPVPKVDDRIEKLENKLTSIEGALQKLVEQTKPKEDYWGWDKERIAVYNHLIENQVLDGLAYQLVSELPDDFEKAGTEDKKASIKKVFNSHIPIASPITRGNGDVRIIPLIGPTGVGKTTTLAKIAAQYALNDLGKVALITADTYRIAAADQLAKYADILGLPLSVVYTPEEMKEALSSYSDYDFVFIDTAGRSPHHETHMEELGVILNLLGDAKVLLLISCNTNYTDMQDIVERFSLTSIAGMVFTKLDEVEKYGNMLNLIYHVNIPVMYLTTGQNVPEDIEPAEPERISDLVWGDDVNLNFDDEVEENPENDTLDLSVNK